MHLRKELENRWFLHQYTHEEIFDLYDKGGQRFYFWVDLSSDSMTIGNLCWLMQAFHLMKKGNVWYLLVWGATSTIWNPSWKDTERPVLSSEQLAYNQKKIHNQIDHLTKRASQKLQKPFDYKIINNNDFFKNFTVLDFLRDVWKYITVNWMMNKEIVKKRIQDDSQWISFAEFSYMLIMWYDFYKLYKDENVYLQTGG